MVNYHSPITMIVDRLTDAGTKRYTPIMLRLMSEVAAAIFDEKGEALLMTASGDVRLITRRGWEARRIEVKPLWPS